MRDLWQKIFRIPKSPLNHCRIEVATQKHAEDIEKFMLSEFGMNEPITQSLKPTTSDLCNFFHDLSEYGYSNEKYSTVVYSQNRLMAICLCSVANLKESVGPIEPEIDAEHHDFAEEICKGPYKQHKANQIVTYITALERRQWRLLGDSAKVFKMNIMCVLKEFNGRGIGKELTRRAIDMAKSEGCEWVATVATASASQAIFFQLGFKVLYEIPYCVFRENGKVVFRNLHDGCHSGKFMALRIK
ncbi:acetyltransferase, GNAT family [Necator americanus]|uniref:aralkylamine N-acetyltransferase n=1 Tax=Necator americanus TaxID=51031 RepID=W2T2U9_NECAM|nr:acetyltransferase, GNAT family [Necator americanus]ETN75566.1 acetyltransferase, GNAT family [Necator americanus]